jgi:hypothetical protein
MPLFEIEVRETVTTRRVVQVQSYSLTSARFRARRQMSSRFGGSTETVAQLDPIYTTRTAHPYMITDDGTRVPINNRNERMVVYNAHRRARTVDTNGWEDEI